MSNDTNDGVVGQSDKGSNLLVFVLEVLIQSIRV